MIDQAVVADIDARLLAARDAYYAAMDAGHLDAADLAYAQLDRLLEQRIKLPQQRPAS